MTAGARPDEVEDAPARTPETELEAAEAVGETEAEELSLPVEEALASPLAPVDEGELALPLPLALTALLLAALPELWLSLPLPLPPVGWGVPAEA